jgi:hypothetical protein
MPYWFDGNSLVGRSAAGLRNDRQTRRGFLELLSRLHVARGGGFEVYFDGDDPDRARPPRGVRLRYCAPLSADDAIIGKLGEIRAPAEITVVTNDRALATACRDAGARTMDWARFSSGIKYRRDATGKEDPVNVDEWAKYFGIEDATME